MPTSVSYSPRHRAQRFRCHPSLKGTDELRDGERRFCSTLDATTSHKVFEVSVGADG